jgi:hypothetical protein
MTKCKVSVASPAAPTALLGDIRPNAKPLPEPAASAAGAARPQTVSRQENSHARLLEKQLLWELTEEIAQQHLKQV